jgi:hypothetical protein
MRNKGRNKIEKLKRKKGQTDEERIEEKRTDTKICVKTLLDESHPFTILQVN